MTEFEKQEYEKNPSIKTALISQSRLEKAMKITIKEELGESVVYVEVNDKEEFVKVGGAYKVYDVKVNGEALDPAKTYTLASHNYMLKSGGLSTGYPLS
mgnify:CR=1 FL=1